MSTMLMQPVDDASAWYGSDLVNDPSWTYCLTTDEVQEVQDATASAVGTGKMPHEIRAEDFRTPALSRTIARLRDEVEHGRGFVILRNIPVGDYTVEENKYLYAGLIAHLGSMIFQHANGCLIDEVTNKGGDYGNIEVRGYQTNAHLTPHCDSGDIVALLCIRPAKEGGTNIISSFTTVYNEILKNHTEYLKPLYNGFHYNIRGGGPPGPWQNITRHRVPVYTYYEGRLSGRFNAKAIKTAEELPGVEPLDDLAKAAIDCVGDLAMRPDLRLDVDAQAGDLMLLCNHMVMHNRTGFVDYDDVDRRRLLLRAWVNIPNGRALPVEFDDHYNTGPRQGTYVQDQSVVSS